MRSINIFGSSVTHELWVTKNVLNHTVKLGFFAVPVLDLKIEPLFGEGLGQGFDEGHRTVFAAGTAHGHGHIGFAFMMILGHEKGYHVLNFGQIFMGFAVGQHVILDILVQARLVSQICDKEGIGQKARIETEIEFRGQAVLESETHQGE